MKLQPELEVIPEQPQSLIYLEHGWPDPLCRWHSHMECELHLIVATTGRSYIGDYVGDFTPGSLYLTGPHLPHNWISDDVCSQPVSLRDMVVQFDAKRILQFAAAFPEFRSLDQLLTEAASGLEFCDFDLDTAQREFAKVRDQSGPKQVLSFLHFLLQLGNHRQRQTLSTAKLYHDNRTQKQVRICEVVDHIVANFADPITLEEAASIAGMSTAAFSRNFQQTTGNRFVEFVNRVRIGQACSRLHATDEQISTICFAVGFQNLANFNRHFLKMKGMTPKQFRETALQELSPKRINEEMSA